MRMGMRNENKKWEQSYELKKKLMSCQMNI